MARKQTQEEYVSQLPPFKVTVSKDHPGWLIVECGREDCADFFLVRKSHWTRKLVVNGHTITGRSCPYCFRAGRMPTSGRRAGQV
jgi:hypothetical protein